MRLCVIAAFILQLLHVLNKGRLRGRSKKSGGESETDANLDKDNKKNKKTKREVEREKWRDWDEGQSAEEDEDNSVRGGEGKQSNLPER